jgi:hypothetical protein
MTTHYAKSHSEKAAIAEQILNSKGLVSVEVKRIRTRSQEQNAAMHLWLEWVAKALNEGGHDMQTVLSQTISLSWSKDSAKENLWRPIQRAMMKKESTTELYKPEVSDVYEHLNRFLAEKFGISIRFPNKNDLENRAKEGGW